MKYLFGLSLIGICVALIYSACRIPNTQFQQQTGEPKRSEPAVTSTITPKIVTGADNFGAYIPLLANKKIGIVTNQTGIVTIPGDKGTFKNPKGDIIGKYDYTTHYKSIVDFLVTDKLLKVSKIFAPEHGFRGTADAGEHIKDGKDPKTGLPIVSLYGDNKKPKKEQLTGIEVMIFDIQDVGVRFYTYISTLHYVMEACAENKILLLVLDRPNPNGGIVDGPVLEKEHTSFVGMHPIPVLHGMTVGEYATMINGEKWLKNGMQCELKVVPCLNYNRTMNYSLPVKPSPNLPNDQSINLYASLCLFEGTNVSVGRGTETQFQIYGSPFLKNMSFEFTPKPNFGAKDPMHNGKKCFGEDLTKTQKTEQFELKWLLYAYQNTTDKSKFFNDFFTKLAGTKKLQRQVEAGSDENEIRKSWEKDLATFNEMRGKYLMY
jgi:uncharacterized protein YbbC (DUF1343 family)